MSSIEADYLQLAPSSAREFQRGLTSLPGGVSRVATYWRPFPLTLTKGAGCNIWDVDGNGYFDLVGNHTSLIHGHGFAPVVEAAQKVIRNGTAWSALVETQCHLAEEITSRVVSIEQVRFTNSGTEAAELAKTISRSLTGRRKVLMARYGYHGSGYDFMMGTRGRADADVLIADYGDSSSFEAVLDSSGEDIAAVYLEPVMGSGGLVSAPAEFFQKVQHATRRAGALFIVDEVITLRLHHGGYQSVLGLDPDLTLMGKIIGGGFPVGAVGGKREHMRVFNPPTPAVLHGGTFNANPVTMAAGVAAYRAVTQEQITRLDKLGEKLERGLIAAASHAGLPLSVNRVGSLLNLFFTPEPPRAVQERQDTAAIGLFHLAALNHGLFLADRGLIALSTPMDDEIIEAVLERAEAAFVDVAAEWPDQVGSIPPRTAALQQ
jgi:glutamate-1-semialdehyde 2,1-aminomutase